MRAAAAELAVAKAVAAAREAEQATHAEAAELPPEVLLDQAEWDVNVCQRSDDFEGLRAALRRMGDAEALIATQLSGDEKLARLLDNEDGAAAPPPVPGDIPTCCEIKSALPR